MKERERNTKAQYRDLEDQREELTDKLKDAEKKNEEMSARL